MESLLLASILATHTQYDIATINCANTAIKALIEKGNYMVLIYDNSTSWLVHDFLSRSRNISFHLSDISDSTQVPMKAHLVTILTSSVENFRKYLKASTRSFYFKPFVRYFVLFTGDEDDNAIFEITSRYYLKYVTLLDKYHNFFVNKAYQEGCGTKVHGRFVFECKDANFTKVLSEFTTRRVFNFKKCSVTVLAVVKQPFVVNVSDFTLPGVEVELLKKAADLYNFTLDFVASNYTNRGHKLGDGSYTGKYKEMFERKAQIMIGCIRTNDTYLEDFTATQPYFSTNIVFIVPKARQKSKWNATARVFSLEVWYLIFTTFALMAGLVTFLHKILRRPGLLDLYGLLIARVVLQPMDLPSRYIFGIWALFSYVISSAYETTFLSFLIKPQYEPQINTLEEIVASPLKVGGTSYMRDLYWSSNSNPTYEYINNKWTECPTPQDCLTQTAFNRTMATSENEYLIRYFSNLYDDEYMMPRYHTISDTMVYYLWFLMQKGLPYEYPLHQTLLKMSENGILPRIVNKYLPKNYVRTGGEFRKLNLDELLLIFYIYGGGILISSCTILAEVFVYIKSKPRLPFLK